jgi:hypothetical protein
MNVKRKAVIEDEDLIDDVEEFEIDNENQTEQGDDESNSIIDQGDSEDIEGQNDDEDEVVVSIGEEAPPTEEHQQAPEWVRELRKQHRELQRKNRELEAKLQTTQTETKPVALGKKPTLDDYDYDAEKFEAALTDWYERKKQADADLERARQAEDAQKQLWQDRLNSYGKAKAELKVRDFEDAEATVSELLNVTQQGVVLQGADNPALVIYALGKNQKKAAELAKINDPVKFAFAVAKLEKELKVTNRKAAPAPERVISGTGRVSGAVDSTLERLRAEAEKTGNYTKVIQYKKQKRDAK